jgi:hypothetical protein
MPIKVGITGTRFGMNDLQFEQVSQFLSEYFEAGAEFHHGNCVGVDAEAALIAKEIGYLIVSHPGPINCKHQSNVGGDVIMPPQTHFKRNRNIVDTCDGLMVVPLQNEHQPRGGTWYTYDYAVKIAKPIWFFPRTNFGE